MNNNTINGKNICWLANYNDKQFRNKHHGRGGTTTSTRNFRVN